LAAVLFFGSGSFQIRFWGSIFSQSGFQVLGFFVGGSFFSGFVSGSLYHVAQIGFKVFGLRFGLRWF
jgi:hypothetical protein